MKTASWMMASVLIALAGVAATPSVSADESYVDTFANCPGSGIDTPDKVVCFVGGTDDANCTLLGSIVRTGTEPTPGDIPDCVQDED